MNKEKESEKELSPKEKLEAFASFFAFWGINMLIVTGLVYLLGLSGKPKNIIFSTIGNILINTIGKAPGPIPIAFILFIAAGILGIGTFLKESVLQEFYLELTFFMWIISIGSILILAFISLIIPISTSTIIGIAFILFISPPIVFVILMGVIYLMSKFDNDEL